MSELAITAGIADKSRDVRIQGQIQPPPGTPAGNVLTADAAGGSSWQPAAGGGGGRTLVFSSTLAAPASIIDTGAGAIPGTGKLLEIYAIARTGTAVAFDFLNVTLNNDSGANYDVEFSRGLNVTASAQNSRGQTVWGLTCTGASATASNFASLAITIPMYAGTTAFKTATGQNGIAEAVAANCLSDNLALTYRSTAAITRCAISTGGAGPPNFVVGTTLLVYVT